MILMPESGSAVVKSQGHLGNAGLQRVPSGELGAYACMLGGEDRRTLFVCTNSTSGPAAAEARAGRIEYTRVDIPGVGLP